MPLPFEQFQGKGVLGFSSLSSLDSSFLSNQQKIRHERNLCYLLNLNNGVFPEPTSVLDSITSPSPTPSPNPFLSSSTTTLSSSHGGPSGGAATFSGADEKSDQMGFEDLDGVLSNSPSQEQSIFRLIMAGDVVDPTSGYVGFDPGSGFGSPSIPDPVIHNQNPLFNYGFHEPLPEEKLQLSNPEALINPNPGFFSVGSDPPSSPPLKRLNSGQPGSEQWVFPFSDPGQDSLNPVKLTGDDQSALINQLFNAAELIGTTINGGDNPILAQGILARLNHNLNNPNPNLNPKSPFQRAALYITEALNSLLHDSPPLLLSPHNLILKIASYKTFSETSPFLQFINFTSNQTILETIEGFNRIHIVDFDIGYGTQWASLIQEISGRNKPGNPPLSLKITAFASPSTISDEFELRFTEENLRNFAAEFGISFEIELLNMEILLNPTYWPLYLRSSEKQAIAVNLPINSIISSYLPLILRFLKQISPNVVVSSDTTLDRNNETPFPNAVIQSLQYFTSLVESLGAANPIPEAALSIERFCIQSWIQKLLMNRHRCWIERLVTPPWRSLIGQCGFCPVMLSSTAETQAEYLLQKNPMRGFHVEKRQLSLSSSSSLVLCWQRKELVTVSAWKC